MNGSAENTFFCVKLSRAFLPPFGRISINGMNADVLSVGETFSMENISFGTFYIFTFFTSERSKVCASSLARDLNKFGRKKWRVPEESRRHQQRNLFWGFLKSCRSFKVSLALPLTTTEFFLFLIFRGCLFILYQKRSGIEIVYSACVYMQMISANKWIEITFHLNISGWF